jgi:uncharacterized membrane protein YoaK (UPF0700 family)
MADHPSLTPQRVLVGLPLTAVGGFVDCFSYIALHRVYTATMSGNTVAIAFHAGRGETGAALIHAYAVGVFVTGLLLSSLAIEVGLRRHFRRVLALALAIEVACLLLLALRGVPLPAQGAVDTAAAHWPLYALLALAAIAMGTQNTSLRMAGILAIFTTHVTGALTRFVEQFAAFLFAWRQGGCRRMLAQACFPAGLWCAFLLGTFAASELMPLWGAGKELALPIGVLLLVIVADIVEPFAEPRRAPLT